MNLEAPEIRETGDLRFVGVKRPTPFMQWRTVPGHWRVFMAQTYPSVDPSC